jgi:predicted nicotinamide N-methyase
MCIEMLTGRSLSKAGATARRACASTCALERAILDHSVFKSRADLLFLRHRIIDAQSSPQLYHPSDNTDAEAKAIFAGNEPYWPFCWAGGYALSRHLIANSALLFAAPSTLLDLGAGGGVCGLAAIAGANSAGVFMPSVIFNDIDEAALIAARLNLEETIRSTLPNLKGTDKVTARFEQRSLLGIEDSSALEALVFPGADDLSERRLVVACGDILYSSELGREILKTLARLLRLPMAQVEVLVGDPGRFAFKELVLDGAKGRSYLQSLGLTCEVVGSYTVPPPSSTANDEFNIEGLDGFEANEQGEIQVVRLALR